MNKTFTRAFVIIVLLGLGQFFVALPVQAATVLIDWSTSNDISGSADANGNHWNSFGLGAGGDVPVTNLVDSTGALLDFQVSVETTADPGNNTGAGFGGAGIDGPVGPNPFDITGTDRPTVDGIYANYNDNGTSKITFTNLYGSSVYNISAIGGRAGGGSDGYIKVLQGTNLVGAVDIDLVDTDDFLDTYALLNIGTVTNFSVTATADGVIELQFFEGQNDTDGGTSATLNALSLTGSTIPPAGTIITIR